MSQPEQTSQNPQVPLSPEDAKLVTLARATRARAQAAEGAAVRDGDGRTYAAATVDLPSFAATAVQACVAMAVASAAPTLEAAVVLGAATELAEADRSVLHDLAGAGVVVHLVDARGDVVATLET